MNRTSLFPLFLPLLLFLSNGCTPQPTHHQSTLIAHATIVDGTGRDAFEGSLRIQDGVITDIGALHPLDGEAVVDASGLTLAPGFIDTHSHHDGDRDAIMLAATSQGITTVVVGQDGFSLSSVSERFATLKTAPLATNLAAYAAHGRIRRMVLGDDFRREATEDEIRAMQDLLVAALDAGALGLSTGLEYDPGIYASTEEVLALAKTTAAKGGRYISHIRSEDRWFEGAVEEIIRIGKEAALPVQISHVKLARRSLWGKADWLIERLNEARREDVDISADIYPYEYWQSTMTVLFPERDFTDREYATYVLRELVVPSEMHIVLYEANPSYAGMTLEQIAQSRGVDAVTAYLDLIDRSLKEDAAEQIVARSMSDADIGTLLRWDHTNVCSDGAGISGHPRGHGAFPRVLRHFVRDTNRLSLPEAIHKMTGLSAAHMGIVDRGTLEIGMAADLVLFNAATISDNATIENPHELSTGITHVWVNGEVVFKDGAATGALPGLVLKRTHL